MAPVWETPETTAIGREPVLPFLPADAACLDGTWRFQLVDAPDAVPGGAWRDMPVPSLWTMQGVGDLPQYTNVQMPFDTQPPRVPNSNATGIYTRTVHIPVEWIGRRVVLRVGGWESFLQVEVNGARIAMAKDGRLAADFDITDVVHLGDNQLLLRVSKWSDATFIEDQDQWWHGGLSRSVMLFTTPLTHVAQLHLTPTLDAGSGILQVRGRISGDAAGHAVRVCIPGREAEVLAQASSGVPYVPESAAERATAFAWFTSEFAGTGAPADVAALADRMEPKALGSVTATLRVDGVLPWSAEQPMLYDVTVEHLDAHGNIVEAFHTRAGFRRVEVRGPQLLVNDRPVSIFGVNRHDFHPVTGRVLTCEDIRADLLELKRWNVNAIRTSHYPNDAPLLDLADELGFYVVSEANVESHAFMHTLCDDPRYLNAFVERVARMVQRDQHHPSVIAWSLGNESGYGANHDAAAAWVRRFDPTRPLHYEGAIRGDWTAGHAASDIVCPMYPSIEAIVRFATSGSQDRPLIMCEYSHAMGNSNGNLREYWDAIEAHDGLQGGFIWEMWDHGLRQVLDDGSVRVAYGGDFGESRHDGNFCCDGVFFPDRTAKPALQEFKAIASPLRVERIAGDLFRLHNRQWFVDSTGYEVRWTADQMDGTRAVGVLSIGVVPPRGTLDFQFPIEGAAMVTFEFVRTLTTPWAEIGSSVGWSQCVLDPAGLGPLSPTHFAGDDTTSQATSLARAAELSLWRAPTDNDRIFGIGSRWDAWGLRKLQCLQEDVQSDADGSVHMLRSLRTPTGILVRHERTLRPRDRGVVVTERVTIPEELSDVARVGITVRMDTAQTAEWFGRGPHETYPDRDLAPLGTWSAPIDALHTDYIRPQENGGREDVAWMLLRSEDATWRIVNDEPLHMSVSRYSDEQLADVAHNVDLRPEDEMSVHIDAAHRGVGTASCGPDTLPEYLVPTGTHEWTWHLSRVG